MMEDTFEFLPMALQLTTKDEVFAFVDDYDEDTYILKDAYRIVRGYSSTGVLKVLYEPLCPYSDDVFTLISKSHVLTTNEMNDYYFEAYLDILNGVGSDKVTPDSTDADQSNDEIGFDDNKPVLH